MKPVMLARAVGDWRGRAPTLSESLEQAIGDAILDGRIALGSRMPSERSLADALSVSRVTVSGAYGGLRTLGWLTTEQRARSRARLPDALNGHLAAPEHAAGEPLLDLTSATPIAPLPAYLHALSAAADDLRRHALGDGVGTVPALRRAVADRYARAGLPTDASQVLVTAGAAAALTILTRGALPRGAAVVVESPTYPGALDILRAAGLRPYAWPALAGHDVDLLAEIAADTRARAAYVIPDFHNPTGALMDTGTRRALAARAAELGLVLIVDETLRDLPLHASQPPALTPEPAVHIGSLSKIVWAGLRIGWIRAPATLVASLAAQPLAQAVAPPPLEQLVALHLMDELPAIGAARRRELRTNLDGLQAAIAEARTGSLARLPEGGLSAWLALPPGVSSADLARRAPAAGLRISPGSAFSPDGTLDGYLRMPLTHEPKRQRDAIAILEQLVERGSGGR
jgi:DNA-binding transcriptional MocR family regulator